MKRSEAVDFIENYLSVAGISKDLRYTAEVALEAVEAMGMLPPDKDYGKLGSHVGHKIMYKTHELSWESEERE